MSWSICKYMLKLRVVLGQFICLIIYSHCSIRGTIFASRFCLFFTLPIHAHLRFRTIVSLRTKDLAKGFRTAILNNGAVIRILRLFKSSFSRILRACRVLPILGIKTFQSKISLIVLPVSRISSQ